MATTGERGKRPVMAAVWFIGLILSLPWSPYGTTQLYRVLNFGTGRVLLNIISRVNCINERLTSVKSVF